jgi:hypothetical protein
MIDCPTANETANETESETPRGADRWRARRWRPQPRDTAPAPRTENAYALWVEVGRHAFELPESAKTLRGNELKQQIALAVRRAWLARMGMAADEINENCDEQRFPLNLDEELENWRALEKLEKINRD